MLVLALVVGVGLISIKSFSHFRNVGWERGIKYAFLAVAFMGAENFLTGYSARLTNPLLTTWVIDTVIAVVMLFYLIPSGNIKRIGSQLTTNPGLITMVSLIDNAAWIAFSY